MTSDELRKLGDSVWFRHAELGNSSARLACADSIHRAADEIDRLTKRVAELEAALKARQVQLPISQYGIRNRGSEASCK